MTGGVTGRYLRMLAELPAAERDASVPGARSPAVRDAFGPRLLTRPVFLDGHRRARVAADLADLYRLLVALPDRLCGGDRRAFGALVGLRPDQIEMVERLSGAGPVAFGRADLYETTDGFRLLEFNLSSAAGGYEIAELSREMLRHEPLAKFAAAEGLWCPDPLALIAQALRRCCADPAGTPYVAVVDWPDSFRHNGACLRVTARLLTRHGLDAGAGHAGELTWRGGRLRLRGRPVDAVYRFFSLAELTSGPEAARQAEPVLRAYAAGAAGMFVPLDLAYVANKRSLSLLFEPRWRGLLTPAETALVDRFVPWTRRVPAGGAAGDLLDDCMARREWLVLKASRMHGGAGALPGWQVDPAGWREALRTATGGGFVVQERAAAIGEPFSVPRTEEFRDWTVNWGMFLVDSGYAGTFVRASPADGAGAVSMSTGAATGCGLDAP